MRSWCRQSKIVRRLVQLGLLFQPALESGVVLRLHQRYVCVQKCQLVLQVFCLLLKLAAQQGGRRRPEKLQFKLVPEVMLPGKQFIFQLIGLLLEQQAHGGDALLGLLQQILRIGLGNFQLQVQQRHQVLPGIGCVGFAHQGGFALLLDRVALDFPELTLIGIHVGTPWADEMIAMAWKHDNIFIGIDAYAPRHLPKSLVHYMNSYGADKVLFGTDWPVIDPRRAIREIGDLGLKPGAKSRLMRDNALAIFPTLRNRLGG